MEIWNALLFDQFNFCQELRKCTLISATVFRNLFMASLMVGIPDTKYLNKHILKHLGGWGGSVTMYFWYGMDMLLGAAGSFFAAVLHRSIQISWILCQNTSVNLTNISCCIYLSKVCLFPWKDSCVSPACFQGTNRSQISKDFKKWIEMNEKLTSWLCSYRSCTSKGGITTKRQMNSAEGTTSSLKRKSPLSISPQWISWGSPTPGVSRQWQQVSGGTKAPARSEQLWSSEHGQSGSMPHLALSTNRICWPAVGKSVDGTVHLVPPLL